MRKLLNTLFVINEDAYLTLDGGKPCCYPANKQGNPPLCPAYAWKASSALLTQVPAPLDWELVPGGA